ncbi:MAG: hypothetical protein AAF503_00725 [Pseudomonadota bacterium]
MTDRLPASRATTLMLHAYICWIVLGSSLLHRPTLSLAIEAGLLGLISVLIGLERRKLDLDPVFLTYMYLFPCIILLSGMISGPSPELAVFVAQVCACFAVVLVLASRDRLSPFLTSYVCAGLGLGAVAAISWAMGSVRYFEAGRLAIFLGNANATGYFFAALIFLSLAVLPRVPGALAAGLSLFLVGLSGSFGAVAALLLGGLAYIFLSGRLVLAAALALPAGVLILSASTYDLAQLMASSELRAFRRIGTVLLLAENGNLALGDLGSGADRRHLSDLSLSRISGTWHANLISGFGAGQLPDSNFPGYAHNGWLRLWYANGLISAVLYALPFHLAVLICARMRKYWWAAACLVLLVFWYSTPLLYLRGAVFPMLLAWAWYFRSCQQKMPDPIPAMPDPSRG